MGQRQWAHVGRLAVKDLSRLPGSDAAERFDTSPNIELGQWYWVKSDSDESDAEEGDKKRWLGCVTEIGSNYFELTSVHQWSSRIHDNKFSTQCKYEPNHRGIIDKKIGNHKGEINRLLKEINETTQRLGVAPASAIEHQAESRSLSVMNSQVDMKSYKKALILAKDKTLPALFEQVESNSKDLVTWMKADSIAIKARLGDMKSGIELIEDRIFNVELYAGLTEKVKVVREGNPAPIDAKLHLMQNRLYMDEECLLEYTAGGMCFKNLADFDKWLVKSGRFDEIFPYPRCLVSFQVRRNRKERDLSSFIKILQAAQEEQLDKATFLYIRNGDQLYRMGCELDFGNKMFPDISEFDMNEPMMAYTSCGRVESLITKRDWEAQNERYENNRREHKAWCKANPKKHEFDSPHHSFISWNNLDQYEPFDKSSVYYDDVVEKIAKDIKQYNRVALILQGLLDRSEILHPHPPARLYTNEGFQQLVTLIYDRDRTLHYGTPPDFKVYQASLVESITEGSVTIGQELQWEKAEAVVENARIARSWREKAQHHERFHPYGDPGPGYLAKVTECSKSKATFRWTRARLHRTYRSQSDRLPTYITVKKELLFNVSAYKPGDFKQFFLDPRTRADYLQWAPFLLKAEDYHAGKAKVGNEEE